MDLDFPQIPQQPFSLCVLSPIADHHRLVRDLDAQVFVATTAGSQIPPPEQLRALLRIRYGGITSSWTQIEVQGGVLVRIPPGLRSDDLIDDTAYWERGWGIQMLPWQCIDNPRSQPLPLRVHVTIWDFPIEYWHLHYFKQVTASMGTITGFHSRHWNGRDKSCISLYLDCPDVHLVPFKMYVLHHERWSECRVTLHGRQDPDDHDFQGPPPEPPPEGDRSAHRNAFYFTLVPPDSPLGLWRRRSIYSRYPIREPGRSPAPAANLELSLPGRCITGVYIPGPIRRLYHHEKEDAWSRSGGDGPAPGKVLVLRQNKDCIGSVFKRSAPELQNKRLGSPHPPDDPLLIKCMWNMVHLRACPLFRKTNRFVCRKKLHPIATKNLKRGCWNLLILLYPTASPVLSLQKSLKIQTHGLRSNGDPAKNKFHLNITGPSKRPQSAQSVKPLKLSPTKSPLLQNKTKNLPQPSVLGPPPIHKQHHPTTTHSLSRYHSPSLSHTQTLSYISSLNPNHTLANHPLMASSSKTYPQMEQADEDLIKKFAGMRTAESAASKIVTIPVQAAVSRQWELCLLARVCSDRLVFDTQFEQLMRKLWNVKPRASFTRLEKNFYLIELTSKLEIEFILNKGPWFYRHDLVAIATCHSQEHLNLSHVDTGEVWVQFHNAPIEALNEEGIELLTGPVGMAISDPIVVRTSSQKYFRVKLQIKIDKPLTDRVSLRHPALGLIDVYVVYERLGRVCLFCGEIGHELTGCSDRMRLARIKRQFKDEERPEMADILKPTRMPWIIDPMLLPTQGAEPDGGPAQGATRQKRNLDEAMNESDFSRNPQGQIDGRSDDQQESGTGDVDGSALTYKKRAKAARSPSPLEI